jgi:hypothetical protein
MKTTFYVQFKAEVHPISTSYRQARDGTMKSLKAVKITQTRPATREGDLTVEFEVEIPDEVVIPKIQASIDNLGKTVTALKQTERELR